MNVRQVLRLQHVNQSSFWCSTWDAFLGLLKLIGFKDYDWLDYSAKEQRSRQNWKKNSGNDASVVEKKHSVVGFCFQTHQKILQKFLCVYYRYLYNISIFSRKSYKGLTRIRVTEVIFQFFHCEENFQLGLCLKSMTMRNLECSDRSTVLC